MAKGIKQIKFTFTSPNDDDSGWERNILSKKKNKKETLYKFNNTTALLIERERNWTVMERRGGGKNNSFNELKTEKTDKTKYSHEIQMKVNKKRKWVKD